MIASCDNTALDCDDGLDCTIDTCDRGTCSNLPEDGLCDDGIDCTTDTLVDCATNECSNSVTHSR